MTTQDDINESQPVCPRCGPDCLCETAVDWDALRREVGWVPFRELPPATPLIQ